MANKNCIDPNGGLAAKSMCSPDAYFGQRPRQTFVIQLQEASAEQDRRKAQQT